MKRWTATLLLLVASSPVFADGMVFSMVLRGRDFSSAVPVTEESQHAIIAHKDGREWMLLAVNFNLADDTKAFWLFPVPGKPKDIRTEVVDVFPRITGLKPTINAQMKFMTLFGAQMLSQPYTWPFMCCMSSLGTGGKDIDVHSVVEKHGLRIETLSAETANALAGYLKEKQIDMAVSELTAFSDYLNEQYSLVFVEISSIEDLLKQFPDYKNFLRGEDGRWPCVFVEFPSEKIFFPLKPTGFYEGPIKIIVKVLDNVKNEQELNDHWHSDYYRQIITEESLPDVFKPYVTEEPLNYTSFNYYGEAAELTDDLWMMPFVPRNIKYAQFVDSFSLIGGGYGMVGLGFLLFLLQSWACAGLTGLILFGKWRSYAVLGLGNVVTLFGVYLLAKYSKSFPETESQDDEKKMKSFRLYGYTKKEIKRREFILLFSFIFMVSSVILYVLFTFPLYIS